MKKTCLIITLFFIASVGHGQNLVPNNSFEDTVSNPMGGVIEDAVAWINCYNTPDYYNAGFNSGGFGFGVPNCYFTGYQNAFDGNAFAGIGLTAIPDQPAEFIGVQLTMPLVIGTKYYVSAYLSRADMYQCASNNFGFKFFNTLYFSPPLNPPPIDNITQVNSTTIVSDSVNWQFVSGSFIADSSYQYLVMGNFYNLSFTNTAGCTSSDASYYYIDAVCVSSDSTTCMIATSIQQPLSKKTQVSIYPNPARDFIYVSDLVSSQTYSLINSLGVSCRNGKLKSGNNLIDVSMLSDGLYILRIDELIFKILINNN
ncbi:hypothetical protein BH10BAC1_BH10BAC1_01240 [soil metagenome]